MSGGTAMRRKVVTSIFIGAATVIAAIYQAEFVRATPANPPAFTGSTMASGTFDEFQVFNHSVNDELPVGFPGNTWLSLQKTKGPSDLYVQSNVWQPVNATTGVIASTGWHTHPGHSLIIVTAGTITEYHEDCTPLVHHKGDTFVDPGGDHVHIIRNESPTDLASTIAVQLVPHDPQKLNRRIDRPAPDNCQSIF
jgi:hypothetical protein